MSGPVNNKPKDQKMIKIEFPSDRSDIALAIGRALIAIGQGEGLDGLDGEQVKVSLKASDVVLADSFRKAFNPADTRTEEAKTEERDNLYQHTPDPKPGETQTRGDSHGAYEQVGKAEGRVDEKLVVFNDKFCGEAAIPFYASGKQKGQWKKRKGLVEGVYEEWYAAQLLLNHEQETPKDEPAPDPQKAANAFKKTPVADANEPKNFAELMSWFANQQTAGNYEAHHLEAAFKALNLSTIDLVQDATGDKVREVYEYLA
jgi:hypothetical protein